MRNTIYNVYSIFLFYPITLEGRRGTTDEFATIPFHLDLFSAALVEIYNVPFFNRKRKSPKSIPNLQLWDFFPRDSRPDFETTVENQPSVFEPLKVFCTQITRGDIPLSWQLYEIPIQKEV